MTTGNTHALEVKGTKISFRFIGWMKRSDFMKIARFVVPGETPGSTVIPTDFKTRLELSDEVVKFLPSYIADLNVVKADGTPVTPEQFYNEMLYSEAVSEIILLFLGGSLPKPEDIKNS